MTSFPPLNNHINTQNQTQTHTYPSFIIHVHNNQI